MPQFTYIVKDKSGGTHKGNMEAASRNDLVEQLWKQDFVVLSIQEQQKGPSLIKLGQPKVGLSQLVVFARQLATMVSSGIPLVSALDVLSEQLEDKTFHRLLKKVRDDVEGGASLSEAFSRHPRVFSELFVNMVRAGESSGKLDEILDRLASYLEKAQALQHKVRSSLFYPILVTVMAGVITSFLIIVVVPKFKEIFTSLGGELPLPTQILIGISDIMRKYLPIEIILLFALVSGVRFYIATPAGRAWFDKVKLKIPLIGKILQKVAIARFSRTLTTLVKSGVPILTSMEIVAKTAGNKVIEKAVLSARASIKEGENISDPLAASKIFPPMVTRMISVGEKTGELEKMLSKIAEFYENEVDAAVAGLTSMIEPIVIAFLGIVIGAIVVALYLPVFKVSQLVNK